MVSLLLTVVMGVTFLHMWSKAHFAQTRRLSFIPLLCAVLEATGIGGQPLSASPLLSLVRVALYVVIAACCFGEMKRDARRFAYKRKRLAAVSSISAQTPHQCA